MFIDTDKGLIPLRRVLRAYEYRKDSRDRVGLRLDDDSEANCSERQFQVATSTVIPAAPGYFVVYIDEESTTETVENNKTAIIAWAIGALDVPIPITANGMWDGSGDYQPIMQPDGRVVYDECSRSVEEAIAEMRRIKTLARDAA